MPDFVAPVVTEATVDRDGMIATVRNAIARDVLTPLTDGEFSIESVATLDEFLTETSLSPSMGQGAWESYRAHCRKMVDTVIGG